MSMSAGFDINAQKSFERLSGAPYTINGVFKPADYDWPGDFEGRSLLAFCCHFGMTGKKIPCMDLLAQALKDKVNGQGFLGAEHNGGPIDEQQLSGHSWFLRGLIAYAELFNDKTALDYAKRTVHNLFIPALKHYDGYPADRSGTQSGGVYGNLTGAAGGWRLSTDIGCAFIPLDGLAHYYAFTKDGKIKKPLENAIEIFMGLDKVGLKMQTHAALTAARGILKFYGAAGGRKYLSYVKEIFDLYVRHGMTLTYENFNWFGRFDTWTEPCAVVDSLILAAELYKLTGDAPYKKYARRIWFNGLQFCQRFNGGAGPDTCVTAERPFLRVVWNEAVQCCTMRYAEGLSYYMNNKKMLKPENGGIVKEDGRYFINDWLLAEDVNHTFPKNKAYKIDGRSLIMIPSLNTAAEKQAENACLKIVFE